MRHPIIAALAAMGFALLIAAEGAADTRRADIPATLSPKLAAALKGRVAGTPVDCVNLRQLGGSQIVDNSAIIYRESARRWYVNFPQQGQCSQLSPDRAVATRTPSTRLCRMDLIRIFQPATPIQYGSCSLGPFVPYTK